MFSKWLTTPKTAKHTYESLDPEEEAHDERWTAPSRIVSLPESSRDASLFRLLLLATFLFLAGIILGIIGANSLPSLDLSSELLLREYLYTIFFSA